MKRQLDHCSLDFHATGPKSGCNLWLVRSSCSLFCGFQLDLESLVITLVLAISLIFTHPCPHPHPHPRPYALDNTTMATTTMLLSPCDSVVVVVATLLTLVPVHWMTQYPMDIPTAGSCRYGYGSPGAMPIRKPIPTYQVQVFTRYGYGYSSRYLGVYPCYSLTVTHLYLLR